MKDNIDEIYKAYFYEIYYFLLSLCHDHYTAEDLVQETFFRAYLYIENYNGENVKTWLFTVAHHAYIDYYRKHKRVVIKDVSYFFRFFDKKKPIIDTVVMKEDLQETMNLLKEIPEKHKLAILLCDFHGMSYHEAAEVMNVPHTHFKVLLYRGRQALRKRRAEKNE